MSNNSFGDVVYDNKVAKILNQVLFMGHGRVHCRFMCCPQTQETATAKKRADPLPGKGLLTGRVNKKRHPAFGKRRYLIRLQTHINEKNNYSY